MKNIDNYSIPLTNDEIKHFQIAIKLDHDIKTKFPHYSTALVGGACRDLFFRKFFGDIDFKKINDLDFAIWNNKKNIGLDNNELIKLVQYISSTGEYNIVDHIDKFLHVKIFHKSTNYEIEYTSTRKESYHDPKSRKPETVIGAIADDVLRRDFTINAIYLNILGVDNNHVKVEPLNHVTQRHIDDVRAKILNTTTSNPNVIFDEDNLRVLRAIRFSKDYKMTDEVDNIVKGFSGEKMLGQVSIERISEELGKILQKGDVEYLFKSGFISKIMSDFSDFDDKEYKDNEIDHIIRTIKIAREKAPPGRELVFLLSAFFHDIGKATTGTFSDKKDKWQFLGHENESSDKAGKIMRQYKFDNKLITQVTNIVSQHMVTKFFDKIPDKSIIRWILRCDDEIQRPHLVQDVLLFNTIDWGGKSDEWREKNYELIKNERAIANKVTYLQQKVREIRKKYKDELQTISKEVSNEKGMPRTSIQQAREKRHANFILGVLKNEQG